MGGLVSFYEQKLLYVHINYCEKLLYKNIQNDENIAIPCFTMVGYTIYSPSNILFDISFLSSYSHSQANVVRQMTLFLAFLFISVFLLY